MRQDPGLLQKALAAGASPDTLISASNAEPRSALATAVAAKLPDHVRLLLAAGARLEHDPALLCSAIIASGGDALRILTLLLQAGADPNADHGSAFFACLTHADEAGALLLISRLMEYGGDVNCTDRHGRTPLEYALAGELHHLSSTLVCAGARLPEQLDSLPCSDELKALVRRNARDLEVRRLLLGT